MILGEERVGAEMVERRERRVREWWIEAGGGGGGSMGAEGGWIRSCLAGETHHRETEKSQGREGVSIYRFHSKEKRAGVREGGGKRKKKEGRKSSSTLNQNSPNRFLTTFCPLGAILGRPRGSCLSE